MTATVIKHKVLISNNKSVNPEPLHGGASLNAPMKERLKKKSLLITGLPHDNNAMLT